MNKFNSHLVFVLALMSAIWFMLTSWFWTYGINVIISFPFGVLGFIIWLKGRKKTEQATKYTYIGIILLLGVISSIATLIGLLLYN